MPKDEWAKYGKNWKYYRPENRPRTYGGRKGQKNAYKPKPNPFILTFGKYKGRDIRRIPLSYLTWIYYNISMRPSTRQEIRKILFDNNSA